MSRYVKPSPAGTGWHDVVMPGKDSLKHLALSVLRLEKGQKASIDTGGLERAVVFISGSAAVTAGELSWDELGGRRDVWEGRTHTLYMPPGWTFTVEAKTDLQAVSLGAPAQPGGEPFVVPGEQNPRHERGKPGFRRVVYDLIGPEHPAKRLLVGETYGETGEWSSFPPHKHDVHDPPEEARLEEIYFYQIKPETGFAFQGCYTKDGRPNEGSIVRHGDVFQIPDGYHPVSAPPGHSVYYLWALAGEGRELLFSTDPSFKHLL